METAREEERRPYEGAGLGTGGKFRKKPFKRTTHSTPYDRPPMALRNPTGGWLSKLVDPAHRLITSSAHRFFSTVFRKRLPPPQPLSTEANSEARNKQQEAVATDNPGERRGAVDQCDAPSKSSNGGGLNELEQILKQKTFTRSEIDRLTALLHSKTIDTSIENGEKRSEAIPLKSVVSHDTQDGFPKIHAQANGIETHLVSTRAVGSSVLDEDVASPAELAKAFMGSRPSKVSPSTLGFRSQAFRENSAVLSSLPFPSKLPVTPLVRRTSGHAEASENGFITPRSRGRSAIYSMARTPYSRVHQTTSLKGVGSAVSAYGGPSSSQSAREQSLFSSSKQGALKRRSSVLDNDIGSVGPIRRIRQKQSLLSSRGLSPPVSGSLSISGAGLGSVAAQKPSSSIQKLNSFGELKNDYRKASTENEESTMPSTSFSSVPTKSSEMASKILQQLDKLVSPKDKSSEPKLLTLMDKSPTKLSPSMLHGKALKSLDAVDSSKFLVDVQDNNLDGSLDKTIPDARDSTSLKQDMVKENGLLKIVASCEKSTAGVNGLDSAVPKKSTLMSIETTVSTSPIFVASPQKKQAFKMSAHEDFLELDDDVYANGTASHSLTDGRQKVDTFLAERKSHNTEAVRLEKPPAFVECKPATPAVNKKPDPQTSDGSVLGEKNSNFVIAGASSPSMAVLRTEVATQSSLTSDVASPPKAVSNVAQPIFNFGDKVALTKDSNAASPIFSFGSKTIDKVPETLTSFASSLAVTESAATVFGSFSDRKPETSSSFPSVPANATDSVLKVPEPSKVGINDISNFGVFSSIPETGLPPPLSTPTPTSTSTTSTFSFGNLPNSSILNNGSLASTSATPVDFNSLTSQNSSNSSTFTGVSSISTPSVTASSSTDASSSSLLISTPAPSFPARSVFKFGSTASTVVAPVSATLDLPSSESTAEKDMGFGISGTPFGVTAAATASTGSSIFGFGATATSTTDNQSQDSTFGAGSGSMPNSHALSVGTGIASSTQSIPIQFGSTTSSPSSGLAGNTISTGSSIFVSSAPAKVFGSGSTGLGSSASASDTNSISSGSGTPTGLLGSSWQPAKSSIFGSTFSSTSPSPGFSFGPSTASGATTNNSPMVFGASTGSAATTNSAPMVFGASTGSAATTNSAPAFFGSSNGASTSSIFSFTSPPVSASTQPVFGNPSPAFPFSSTASANNDQMNMEDSMAEDTVASVPSVPVFGQQPVLPSPSPSPSGFAFGSASASSPFQFGSQLNVAAPQNPSLFPVSSSIGLLPEGSNFSMGSGGGGVDKSNRKYYKIKGKQRKK